MVREGRKGDVKLKLRSRVSGSGIVKRPKNNSLNVKVEYMRELETGCVCVIPVHRRSRKLKKKIASEWRRQAKKVGNTAKRTTPEAEITVLDDSG